MNTDEQSSFEARRVRGVAVRAGSVSYVELPHMEPAEMLKQLLSSFDGVEPRPYALVYGAPVLSGLKTVLDRQRDSLLASNGDVAPGAKENVRALGKAIMQAANGEVLLGVVLDDPALIADLADAGLALWRLRRSRDGRRVAVLVGRRPAPDLEAPRWAADEVTRREGKPSDAFEFLSGTRSLVDIAARRPGWAILPVSTDCGDAALEAIGFRFGAPLNDDALFRPVQLPAGSQVVLRDDQPWVLEIIDEEGRTTAEASYHGAQAELRLVWSGDLNVDNNEGKVAPDASAHRTRDHLVIGIVDDDLGLASTFALRAPVLFGDEHVVLQVTTVGKAVMLLELAAPDPVDVILVDGYIPWSPSDGLEVMARLRAAGYTGPMVAISSDASIRDEMLGAGCAAACSKLQPKQLERVIRDLLDKTT